MDAKISQISQQMKEVRSDLGDDVEEIAESARTLTDWRHYARQYPWTWMSGAAALGYCLVPKRLELVANGTDALEPRNKRNSSDVKADPKPQGDHGVRELLFGLLTSSLRLVVTRCVGHTIDRMVKDSAAEHSRANGDEK